MAKYKILETAFIGNRLWGPGEVVEVDNDVIPGPHMQPVDAAGKKRGAEVGLINGPMPDVIEQMTESGVVDVTKYGASPQVGQSGMAMGETVQE